MKKINYRILALFLFIIFSWGMAWPVSKIGLMYMSPLWYTSIRLVVGTATMFAVVIASRKFTWPEREDIPLILMIGVLQIATYIALANLGLSYLPAGRSSLLAYTTPLWVMPIATLFFGEESSPLKWLGFCLSISGLVILLSPWEMDWSNPHILFGSAMLLLASLCWAISMLGVRYMRWTKTPLQLIPWQLLIGAIPILIFAWVKEPTTSITWHYPLVLSLIYTGFLVTGLSYWCGVIINKELPTTIVSLGFLSVPVFSLVISSLFLNETITALTASAMVLILLGLGCVVV